MIIKRTNNRNLKKLNRHYERFFIDIGMLVYYVHSFNSKITSVRERIYLDKEMEEMEEKQVTALPPNVYTELNNKFKVTY